MSLLKSTNLTSPNTLSMTIIIKQIIYLLLNQKSVQYTTISDIKHKGLQNEPS